MQMKIFKTTTIVRRCQVTMFYQPWQMFYQKYPIQLAIDQEEKHTNKLWPISTNVNDAIWSVVWRYLKRECMVFGFWENRVLSQPSFRNVVKILWGNFQ